MNSKKPYLTEGNLKTFAVLKDKIFSEFPVFENGVRLYARENISLLQTNKAHTISWLQIIFRKYVCDCSSHFRFKMHYGGYMRSSLHILMHVGSIATLFFTSLILCLNVGNLKNLHDFF